jgi:hypothetical protein
MKPRAIIETERDGETLIVRARYWTPEWVRFIETIWWPLTLIGWLGLSAAAWGRLNGFGVADTFNEMVFWGAVASAGAFALSWAANRVAMRIGGGYGLAPRGRTRLVARLSRKRIEWQGAGRRGAVDREGWSIRFVPRPHRRGHKEERDAAHGQGSYPLSYAYRDAWEIWLQAEERFFLLAAASNEADADAIARRLQAADAEVTRPRQGSRRAA